MAKKASSKSSQTSKRGDDPGLADSPSSPAKQDAQPKREAKLLELINLVMVTADAKGWYAEVDNLDCKTHKYATVAVSRQTPGSYQTVTGIFEITYTPERVKITYLKTSFYAFGLSDLDGAIQNEFWKLPWIKKKSNAKSDVGQSDVVLIERLLRRFHRSVRQLKHRHTDRPTLR